MSSLSLPTDFESICMQWSKIVRKTLEKMHSTIPKLKVCRVSNDSNYNPFSGKKCWCKLPWVSEITLDTSHTTNGGAVLVLGFQTIK